MKKLNPAVKSMLQLGFYLVVLIGVWIVISLLVFPKQTTLERLTRYVQDNEAVLVQIAENAMDGEKNPGILNSADVLKLLGEEHIAAVEAHKQGAAFRIVSDETPPSPGYLRIIYLPDGQYAFDLEGKWAPATADENGSLTWRTDDGSNVSVMRIGENFFLEIARLK